MSQALALIAHDLKNALGGLEALLADLPSQTNLTAAQAAGTQAHRQCQQLRQEFVQFLTLYAAETGELRPLCEDESPQALLNALKIHWQSNLATEGRDIRLIVQTSNTTPAFWYFDRRLLRLALDAAVHNATRFAHTTVHLSCSRSEGGLRFTITDDGPGLQSGSTDARTGTGLGTTLSQAVAQAHTLGTQCGQVSLTDHPAGGACFTLWLP
jgi:signal transduction histidine kinase